MWQGEEFCLQKNSNFEISPCLWDGVTTNEEDISYMFDETTPIKACGDLAYQVTASDDMIKTPEECRETSSQVKRRRMLQFNETIDPFCNEEMPSAFLKSKEMEESLDQALPEVSQWVPGFPEIASASGYDGLDQPEGWLTGCFNDTEMHFSPDDMNFSGASDIQIDLTEFCNFPPEYEANNMVQERPAGTPRKVVFKGRKSYIRTPSKMPSSVAYPFAFIKPCGMHGDVTLKEINQRIRTPPPSKSKKNIEDSSASYPTSAITGKPVVGKTKIRTEGGKGSITIMRTKG